MNEIFALKAQLVVPSTDLYGTRITPSPTPPSVILDSARGRVFSFSGSSFFKTTNFTIPASYSISFWIKATEMNNRRVLDAAGLFAVVDSNNKINFVQHHNKGSTGVTAIIPDIINKWTHVGITFDNTSSTISVYKNGDRAEVSLSNPTLVWTGLSDGITIGGVGGQVDDIRVFGRALTMQEVKAIYDIPAVRPPLSIPNEIMHIPINCASHVYFDQYNNHIVTKAGSTTAAHLPEYNSDRGYIMRINNQGTFISRNDIKIPLSYTKAIWVYMVAHQSNATLISSFGAITNPHFMWFQNGTNLSAGHGNAIVALITDPSPAPLNTWVHFAVTYENSTKTFVMYRNGTAVAHSVVATAWTGSESRMGVGLFGEGHYFNGYCDDVRLYGRALTGAEITTLYQYKKPEHPIFKWLNGAPGYLKVWYDQSGNDKHLRQNEPNQQPLVLLEGYDTIATRINNENTLASQNLFAPNTSVRDMSLVLQTRVISTDTHNFLLSFNGKSASEARFTLHASYVGDAWYWDAGDYETSKNRVVIHGVNNNVQNVFFGSKSSIDNKNHIRIGPVRGSSAQNTPAQVGGGMALNVSGSANHLIYTIMVFDKPLLDSDQTAIEGELLSR